MPEGRFPAFATGLCVLAAVVALFPVVFTGRVVSALDVVANHPPWRAVRPPVQVANPELAEAATAVQARALLARRTGFETAFWNPYTACGSPGWLAWGSGVLSPFVLPWLWVVDEAHLLDLVVFGKLLSAFWFTFLFLGRRGAGEHAAALGGLAYALAVPVAGRWLWPESAGSVLLPALLWVVDGAGEGSRPRGLVAVALAGTMLAAGATPGIAVIAVYLALAWALRRGLEARRPMRYVTVTCGGLAVTVLLLAPAALLRLTWPLPGRPAATRSWGLGALRLLVDPWAWGDPRAGTFLPPGHLAGLPWRSAAVTVGFVAIALAAVGVAARSRDRWWWTAVAALGLGTVALSPVAAVVRVLPGLGRIATSTFAPPAVLALAALAAAGWDAVARTVNPRTAALGALVVGAAMALEQGLVVGHVTPFLRPAEARLSTTPALRWLTARARPGERLVPLFDTLLPDLAAAFRLEDLRSAWGAPAAYRRLLREVDPQSWGPYGSALRFNGATIRLTHPTLAALGARFVLEPPDLHLVEFALSAHVELLEPRTGSLGPLTTGAVVEQPVDLPGGVSRLLLPVRLEGGGSAELRATLGTERGGPAVTRRLVLGAGREAWFELPAAVPAGPALMRLEVVRADVPLFLVLARPGRFAPRPARTGRRPANGAVAIGLDRSGYTLAYDGPDLRIWENLRAAGPLQVTAERGVAEPAAGTRTETAGSALLSVELTRPGRLRARIRSARGATLTTAFAGPPRIWYATVDGRRTDVTAGRGGFAQIDVPPGEHTVAMQPRLPWSWAGSTVAGVLVMAAAWRFGKGAGK